MSCLLLHWYVVLQKRSNEKEEEEEHGHIHRQEERYEIKKEKKNKTTRERRVESSCLLCVNCKKRRGRRSTNDVSGGVETCSDDIAVCVAVCRFTRETVCRKNSLLLRESIYLCMYR